MVMGEEGVLGELYCLFSGLGADSPGGSPELS